VKDRDDRDTRHSSDVLMRIKFVFKFLEIREIYISETQSRHEIIVQGLDGK